jgi:hypothetical protein
VACSFQQVINAKRISGCEEVIGRSFRQTKTEMKIQLVSCRNAVRHSKMNEFLCASMHEVIAGELNEGIRLRSQFAFQVKSWLP